MNIIILTINLKSSSAIMKYNLLKKTQNIKICLIKDVQINPNCIYIFIKYLPKNIDILEKIKKFKGYLLYEPLDMFWNSENINDYNKHIKPYLKYFHGILCNNKCMINIYKTMFPNKKYYLNYHEYDTINKFYFTYNTDVNILYIGALMKTSLTDTFILKNNIINVNLVKNKNNKLNLNGIHIDFILNDNFYYYLHTSTKLATALNFNSIFVCNRVPVYVEILGDNYEYYLEDDLSNFNYIIKKAKNVYCNQDKYNEYINKMKILKNKLSPDNCYKKYVNIFNYIYDIRNKK